MEELRNLINNAVDPTSPTFVGPSLAATVVDKDGQEIFTHVAGSQNDHELANSETIWWLASQTKLVTTIAAMQAVEKGLVKLDDDLTSVLPELASLEVVNSDVKSDLIETRKVKRRITLRYLLSHQSGIGYNNFQPQLVQWSHENSLTNTALDGTLIAQTTCPLLYEPGTGWAYGGGLDWAGMLVARLNGTSLESYMEQNIFNPLGMSSTTFRPMSRGLQHRIVDTYERSENGEALTKIEHYYPYETATEDCGGHGLYSTVADYAKVLGAVISGGSVVLTKSSVDQMFEPQLNNPDALSRWAFGPYGVYMTPAIREKTPLDHGLAGVINTVPLKDRRAAGTMQWSGLPNHMWWIDRKSGLAATLLHQLIPTSDTKAWAFNVEFEKAVYRLWRQV